MAAQYSTMAPLGSPAPDFNLPDTTGKLVDRDDFSDHPALLVMFICNHCPFVIHIRGGLVAFARDYMARGLAIVAISANDVTTHPADGPERMAEVAAAAGFQFPYLYDQSQAVAKAYAAACTPDFFLHDRDHKLVYRGQFDASRPANQIPVTGAELRAAADAVLADREVPGPQVPSIGCNIKWIAGNQPNYF